MTTDDMALLREYTQRNSEEAFAALVSRHVNLVYSVALLEVRNPHLAEEITQAVFIILARKADSIAPKVILSGWLCRTARYASANALSIQRRRQQREQEAYMQTVLNESEPPDAWTQIAPVLGGAMKQLGQKDHDALVLRFFENKSFQEIGTAFNASENAAKKRVAYALEKLRKYLSRQGVTSTATGVAGAISANSIQAAPTMLAKTVTTVTIAKGAAATTSTLILVKGALKIMAWTKAKTAIVVGVGLLLVAGTTITIVKTKQGETQKLALIAEMPVNEQMSAMKMSVFPAILKFAQAHQDELPTSLTDLDPYLPASLNGVDDEHWEILQGGKVTPEFITQRTVILLQQKNVPPEKPKIIVYADGHIEYKK